MFFSVILYGITHTSQHMSNNEIVVNTKFIFGLPRATQVGLEHEKKT